jgi:hypothetical protein
MLLMVPNAGTGERQIPMLQSSGGGGLPVYPPLRQPILSLPNQELKEAANYGGLKSREKRPWGGTFGPRMGVTARTTAMPISIVARACRRRNAAVADQRWLVA